MAITGSAVISEEVVKGLISQVDQLGLLVKGVGVAALIWIIYTSFVLFFEYKQAKKLNLISEQLLRVEKRLENLAKKL